MSLHNEIMNIQHKQGREDFLDSVGYGAYSEGHRDARHAAAELALKYENYIKKLEDILQWYIDEDEINEGDPENQYWVDGKHLAMELLSRGVEG